jgi:hypothetical protein
MNTVTDLDNRPACVIGLFFFLIGIVFFFVKEDHTVMKPGLTIATQDGQFSGHKEMRASWKPPPGCLPLPGSQQKNFGYYWRKSRAALNERYSSAHVDA